MYSHGTIGDPLIIAYDINHVFQFLFSGRIDTEESLLVANFLQRYYLVLFVVTGIQLENTFHVQSAYNTVHVKQVISIIFK